MIPAVGNYRAIGVKWNPIASQLKEEISYHPPKTKYMNFFLSEDSAKEIVSKKPTFVKISLYARDQNSYIYELEFTDVNSEIYDKNTFCNTIRNNFLLLDENFNKINCEFMPTSSNILRITVRSNESNNIYLIDKSELEENGLANLETPENYQKFKIYDNKDGLSEYTITGVFPTGETVIECNGGNSSLRIVVQTNKTSSEDEDNYIYCPKAYLREKNTNEFIVGNPQKICAVGYFFIDFDSVQIGEYELLIFNNKESLIRWEESIKISFSDFSGCAQEKEYLSLNSEVTSYYDKYRNISEKISEMYLVSNQVIKKTSVSYDENGIAKLDEDILTVDSIGVNKIYFKTVNNKIIYTNFDLTIINHGVFSSAEKFYCLTTTHYYFPTFSFSIYYSTGDLPSSSVQILDKITLTNDNGETKELVYSFIAGKCSFTTKDGSSYEGIKMTIEIVNFTNIGPNTLKIYFTNGYVKTIKFYVAL